MPIDILKIAMNIFFTFCPGSAQNGPSARVIWAGRLLNHFNVSSLIIVRIQDRYIFLKIIQIVVLKFRQITFCNQHVF